MKKRAFCLFLCMVMCFSLLPTWAFADGEQPEEDVVVEEEIPAQEPPAEEAIPEEAIPEEAIPEEDVVEEVVEESEPVSSAAAGAGVDGGESRELRSKSAFDKLEEACRNGTAKYEIADATITIERNLTIPAGTRVIMTKDDGKVIVPDGVTLTIRGVLRAGEIEIQGSGKVEVIGQGSWLVLESETWNEDLKEKISCSDEGSIQINTYPGSLDQLYDALDSYQPEDFICRLYELSFSCVLTRENTVIPENAAIVFRRSNEEISLTIPEGKTLTIEEGGELYIEGSELVFNGNIVNNGFIGIYPTWENDQQKDQPKVTVGDNALYSGAGETEYGDQKNYRFVSNRILFGELKAACEGGAANYFDLRNRGDFVIREDLVIPQNFRMETWGTVFTVPNGVTLTIQGEFNVNDLVVESGGQIILEPGSNLWINKSLKLDGRITATNTWFGMPAGDWQESMMLDGRIIVNGADAGVKLSIRTTNESEVREAIETRPRVPQVQAEINAEFAWVLENDFSFSKGVNMHIHEGGLIIPSGLTFENAGGYLGLHQAQLTVAGTLKNRGFLDVRRDEGVQSKIVMEESGAYEGNGEICVRDAADEEEAAGYLGGLTELGNFQVEKQEDGVYFQLREPDWTFAHLQEVCAETYKEGDDNYRFIPNEAPLTIEEDLTIPKNLILNKEGGAIVVPEGVTLTVTGDFNCAGLVADGSVVLAEGGYMNVHHDKLEGKGTIEIQNNSHMDICTYAWKSGEWIDHILFAKENAWLAVWYDVRTAEEALAAVADTPKMNDHTGRSLNVMFDWTLTENLELPNEMWMEIRGNQNGSLTIPKGVTLTMNNTMRVQGADVRVFGGLVNNDRLEVRWDDDYNRLGKVSIEEGGMYDGEGTIWVETLDKPEVCLPGLDLSKYDQSEENGGTLFINNGDVFERMKAALAAGEEFYLPDNCTFTLPEDLTVPAGTGLHFWGSSFVVPEGVTLTVEGFVGGSEIRIGGTVNVEAGGNLNVHGTKFTGENPLLNLKQQASAFVPHQDWEALKPHATLAEESSLNLCMIAGDMGQLVGECTDRIQELGDLGPWVRYWIDILFPYVLESDEAFEIGVQPNVVLEFVNSERENENGSMTIGTNVSFSVDGSLRFQGTGATLTVQGTLINNEWIDLDGDPQNGYGYGSIVFEDGAVYEGEGGICVRREENPEALLGSLAEVYKFEEDPGFAGGTLYRKTASVTVDPALDLHDTIGIKFYILPSAGVNAKELTAHVSYASKYQTVNKDFPLADMSPNSAGEYLIKAIDAASDEMSDTVTLTVKRGSTELFRQQYSIASIADTWLENSRMQDYWPLLRAMLQYGDKAQGFFGNHPEQHITPDGAPALVPIPASYAPGADPTTLGNYIEYCEFGINLETAVGMSIYIKPKASYGIDDISVAITDQNGKAVAATAPALVSGEIKISIPGLYPEQLLNNYNVTVTVNGVSATYVRSVISCAYALEQKGKAVELVEALYQYSLAARAIWG